MQAEMLGPECAERWRDYLAAEDAGIQSERNEALAAFIASAKEQPRASLAEFAAAWCVANLDDGFLPAHKQGAPVRLPLLCDIIGPFLIDGRSAGAAHHSRWLAQLWSLLIRDVGYRARLSGVGGPTALLEEAVVQDPADDKARTLLVRSLIWGIDYSLHELPALLASRDEVRADLDRLAALGPEGYDADTFHAYLAAAREVAERNRSQQAIGAYRDASAELKERR